jgi:hypothetical protein
MFGSDLARRSLASHWMRLSEACQHDQIPFLGRSFKVLFHLGLIRGISDPRGSGVDVVVDDFSPGVLRRRGEI